MPEEDAEDSRYDGENLAHGQQGEEKSKLWVRFSKEFDKEPKEAIEEKE